MSPRPKTTEQHPNLEEAIKETAWQQIAENGASALSLRAIARELGISKPTVYYYVQNKEQLLFECFRAGLAVIEDGLNLMSVRLAT